jgi:hypothetical protein
MPGSWSVGFWRVTWLGCGGLVRIVVSQRGLGWRFVEEEVSRSKSHPDGGLLKVMVEC